MGQEQSAAPPRPVFTPLPVRSFELRSGDAPVDLGPLAEVPRLVVETSALAHVVGRRGPGEALLARVRADSWERALRDANLLAAVQDPRLDAPPALAAQLRTIREGLAGVRALEERLGEDAEEGGMISRREHDGVVVGLCAAAMLTALAPAELRPLLAAGFAVVGGRFAWRAFGPRARVGREQLASARLRLAQAIQAFVEQTWVAALGDRVLESTPHAIYLHNRLTDLDAARGASEAQQRELKALLHRIRQANSSLGRDPDDAETRRIQRQIEDIDRRIALIDRLRAECAERERAHLAQLERQRAIAARRALSSRLSELVDRDGADAAAQEIAVIEVDIADLAARLRGLDVEISSADAELRSVLEVSEAGAGGGRRAQPRRKASA